MNKEFFKGIFKDAVRSLKVNSPTILTCVGVAGMVGGVVVACKATTKAEKILNDIPENAPRIEKVKKVAPVYFPTAIIVASASACIFGGNHINLKRNAALGMLYQISKDTYDDYREKTRELVGEEKEKEICTEVAKEQMKKNPPTEKEVLGCRNGGILFKDATSGRYFRNADGIEGVRKIINDLNFKINNEMFITQNDFFYAFNISSTELGDILEWNRDMGLIEPTFTSEITSTGEPCIVMYTIMPEYRA